jgi:hypothetical protein
VLARQLNELLLKEEIMAKQRSRADWLRAGDRNTGFFHAQASARRTRNRIVVLEKENGAVCESIDDIHNEVQAFYDELYSAQQEVDIEAVLHHVPTKVSDAMNERLLRPFQEDEVESTLFAMAPSKSPGVDGFNAPLGVD